MELTITLDNLDESIEKLRELAHKLEQFPTEVAMESAHNIKYGEAVSTVDHHDGLNIVSVEGNGIAFQEFGAGFKAQTWSENGFSTEPGSWSIDHAQTFQNYQGDPERYRYNQEPKMKVQNEAQRLQRDTEEKARRYFDN